MMPALLVLALQAAPAAPAPTTRPTTAPASATTVPFQPGTSLADVEGEARLGPIFPAREGRRLEGVVGGQTRLGAASHGAPLPQPGILVL